MIKDLRKIIFIASGLIAWFIFCPENSYSQIKEKPKVPTSRILFVFDASASMSGIWESDMKINIARKILISFVDSLEKTENVQMALRVYGHQSPVPPQDCSDTRLEVAFGPNTASKIRQKLNFISPKGTTPIAHSLELAGGDFPPCDNCRNIIILITDGIEACDGDPCKVSDELQRRGISLKPFIIGIGIDENFSKTFSCIGRYFNAEKEDQFKEAMRVVISQALNSTTAQVNLLDENNNPTETNVNMTFFDRYSGQVKHNFIHTINNMGNPDTLVLDPLLTYRMRVNTMPPVWVDSIKVVPGKHTIISASVPQGYLVLRTSDAIQYRNLQFIVRKKGDLNTLNYQKAYETAKYITGHYDLEVAVLPTMFINDVEIKQSHTTTVEIPRPGLVTFIMSAPGFGSVYLHEKDGMRWVYNLNASKGSESLAFQPGIYTAVFRAQNAKLTLYSITKKFEVKSGGSVQIQLY
jgi:Ca-activated chloride channel homolog